MRGRIIIMYMALALLTGCGGRSAGWQTGNVALVRAVGVDLAQGGVTLTAWAGDGLLTADGLSVAEGLQRLQGMGDSFVHFGHADHLVMSEDFARNGAGQLVEFVARDRQIGPGARLWVLREDGDEPAQQVDVAARLERLAEDRRAGAGLDCSVTRLMSVMAEGASVPVPALRWEAGELRPVGYAVLRQGRLVGFLDDVQSLGLELLCGRGGGQTADVTLPGTDPLVLQVEGAEVHCRPRIEAGRLNGAILCCAARLRVAQGAQLTAQQRQEAGRRAEELLCRRMAAALACAQFWDADFVGLERQVRMSCSAREWSGVVWRRDFRTLPLQVTASAEVDWPADMAEEE